MRKREINDKIHPISYLIFKEDEGVSTGTIVFIVIAVILVIAAIVLYFLGKKAQTKQEEQMAQIEAMKQTVSMLIIDKKRMKMKDAGLPQQVLDSANRFAKNAKLPIVKAKIGPQIMSLVCDDKIFDTIPVKKEVKATVSGIYITSVKGLHGKAAPVEVKKKSWWKRTVEKAQEKAGAKSVK